jgi:4-oxalomesaconate hydratase
VKEIRHGEAERAAAALGAEFECLDLGDYPLEVDGEALVSIADRIRAFAPDVVLTHTDRDPFNPDHAAAFFAVEKARALASGAGVPSAFETVEPPELLLFEPHQPELCNFVPTTFVDITPVIEQKNAAMAEMKAQSYLHTYYSQRAEQRGNHARRSSGNAAIRYAEAFQRVTPQVVTGL